MLSWYTWAWAEIWAVLFYVRMYQNAFPELLSQEYMSQKEIKSLGSGQIICRPANQSIPSPIGTGPWPKESQSVWSQDLEPRRATLFSRVTSFQGPSLLHLAETAWQWGRSTEKKQTQSQEWKWIIFTYREVNKESGRENGWVSWTPLTSLSTVIHT